MMKLQWDYLHGICSVGKTTIDGKGNRGVGIQRLPPAYEVLDDFKSL